MLFQYKAKDLKGETVEGTIEAMSEEAAMKVLVDRELIILSLEEAGKGALLARELEIPFFARVGPYEMVLASRQLSTMISSGLSLVAALEILGKQTANKKLKSVVFDITDDVRGGTRFSSALAKYPKIFNDFYINMVRAGETSGKLDESLIYLADEQEKNYDLASKIKGAMTYPIFVMAAVVGIMILMLKFVLPRITGMISEAGIVLPFTTRLLIAVSDFFQVWWWAVILGLIGLVIILNFLRKTEPGRLIWDRISIKIPVFGPLFKKICLARFTRSLSTLIVGGIPLTSAIKVVSDVVGNVVYRDLFRQSIKDVEEGRSISTSLLKSPDVPKMLSHILVVGEETGKLDEVLDKMADFYTREIENTLSRLVTLLEPIIIICLGAVVALMVSAILMPMYQMASVF